MKLKHQFFSILAKFMVKKESETYQLHVPELEMNKWNVAFLTTAGVHLTSQEIFDVDAGDHTFRKIPDQVSKDELMITHTHYDTTDAMKDINCVFPVEILHELKADDFIGNTAATHYGLMGYIPKTEQLISETIPAIIQQLKKDKVDVVLMSPG